MDIVKINDFISEIEEHPDETEFILRKIIRGNDAIKALTFCLMLKERNYFKISERNLILLQRSHPDEAAISYELGVLLARSDPIRSEIAFLRALKLAPGFESAFRGLAVLYLASGRIDDFTALIKAQAHTPTIPFATLIDLARLHAYIDQIPLLPSPTICSYENAVNYGVGVGDAIVSATFEAVIKAINNRNPFALVRLGDGEGALWRFNQREELANFAEYWAYRDYFSNRWYGQGYGHICASLDNIQEDLSNLLPTADIVAAPSKDWIRHEGYSANIRTFVCCTNAARAARTNTTPRARTSVHFDLLDSGGLAQIIDTSKQICLVTSHRAMVPLMETRFPALGEVELIIIPPAFSDLSLTNHSLLQRSHELVDQILGAADGLDRGYTILIGAGFIGKLLTVKLKSLGFIALDVGSVFDLVLEIPTRPTFSRYDPKTKFQEGVIFTSP